MDGKGALRADPEHGSVLIGPGPQMGHGTQVLVGVAFFLEGIIRTGLPHKNKIRGFHLPALALSRRFHQRSPDLHRRSGIDRLQKGESRAGFIDDDLDIFQAGAVVELDKGETLGISLGPDPTLYQNRVLGRV